MSNKQATDLKNELEKSRYELSARSRRITELEFQLAKRSDEIERLNHALEVREQRVRSLSEALDDAEDLSACFQERVLSAAKRIRTDEASVAKAKKAIAVAITVLNDQASI